MTDKITLCFVVLPRCVCDERFGSSPRKDQDSKRECRVVGDCSDARSESCMSPTGKATNSQQRLSGPSVLWTRTSRALINSSTAVPMKLPGV